MRALRFFALLSLAALVLCAASFADTLFDFSTDGHINADAVTFFGAGGASITIDGFSKDHVGLTDFPTLLWYKHDGGAETGIGDKDDPSGEDEIEGTNFVQFTDKGITSVEIGSDQTGETWTLYESTTLGTLGKKIASGHGNAGSVWTESLAGLIDPGYGYISLVGGGTNLDGTPGNILLADVTYAPAVPEPSTPAFIITLGLVGLFEIGRRKLMA